MIQFSVFDKDIITADDFGGETYFPLSAVPGIHSLRYINDYKLIFVNNTKTIVSLKVSSVISQFLRCC